MLKIYGSAAEEMAESIMERTIEDVQAEYGCTPAALINACLMVADHLYTHRSAVTSQSLSSVPYAVDALLKPLIRY